MSYIARLASRSGAPTASGAGPEASGFSGGVPGASLVPALRSDSPIAQFDQRFNLPGFGALTGDASLVAGEGESDIAIEEDAGELESGVAERYFDPSPLGASARATPGVPSETWQPHRAGTAADRGATRVVVHEPGAVIPVITETSRGTTDAPERTLALGPVAHPESRLARPSHTVAPFEASAPRAPASFKATPAPVASETRAGDARPAQPADFTTALHGALARVEAWMRSDKSAAPSDAPFEGAASPGAAHGAQAFAAAPISDAPSRLNIGRLDVEVIAPPMAPPTSSTVQYVMVAPSAPRPQNLGRFGFGVRQR